MWPWNYPEDDAAWRRNLPRGVLCLIFKQKRIWVLSWQPPWGGHPVMLWGDGWDPQDDAWNTYFWHCVEVLTMKKRDVKAGVGSNDRLRDDAWLGDYPLILEHLTAPTFDDGTRRETSTLMVFVQHGLWMLMLRDRAEGYCAWMPGETLEEAFQRLEAALDAGDPSLWRLDRRPGTEDVAKRKK